MKKTVKNFLIILCFALCFLLFPFGVFSQKDVGMVRASANGDIIKIHAFQAELTVQTDRKVVVKEKITVEFLADDLTMFYRSLPTDGAIYSDISARCNGNDAFSWYVEDNPDVDGFFDINCVGNAKRGATWTYELSYTMLGTVKSDDGMIIDIVPFGFTVPLNEVQVTVRFPAPLTDYQTFVGYGSTTPNPDSISLSLTEDGKTLTVYAKQLGLSRVDKYGEYVAKGVTLRFSLPSGVLQDYISTHTKTRNTAWIIVLGVVFVGLAWLLVLLCRKKGEIVTVVNLKAPDEMDPLAMGKTLDGTVDNEDVTSMVYYFAYRGYLTIDLTDDNNPTLTTRIKALPETESVHARTLFDGLFADADERYDKDASPFDDDDGYTATVELSSLKGKFYETVEMAKLQLPKKNTYQKRSVFGFIGGGLLGALYAFLVPLIAGLHTIGGGYTHMLGVVWGICVPVVCLLGYVRENYRYKWKKTKRTIIYLIQLVVSVVVSALFCAFVAEHILTVFERVLLCVFATLCNHITLDTLSREETLCETLGQIIGFKDFIVFTEEDKIKEMLEINPTLYYKVLPYAQVLGVTDEWTDKFKNLTIAPPQWCSGTDVFDYWFMSACISRSMTVAMTPPSSGGSGIGRSGGGGSFGGFGGGGFGGGGGGAR